MRKQHWADRFLRRLPRFGRRQLLCVLLICVLATLSACSGSTDEASVGTPTPSATTPLIRASVTPAPTLENDPAELYTNVITDHRVISLILEGFTDDNTMEQMLASLKAERVPAQFYISGIVADEHPDAVKSIADAGFTVGNYGLNAEKDMQTNDVLENIHQFSRGQELLRAATGDTPTLFRCNGTEYTREVLQAAAYAGLRAGVRPNAFLNHSSFSTYEDALLFVQRLARGSIVSIKLGQVLDADEYEGTTYNMDYLSIDPGPMLSDRMEDIIASTYANIVNVVTWLLQALDEEGYVVITPEALQGERITLFDNPRALSDQALLQVDPAQYALPVTADPLTNLSPLPAATAVPAASASASATAGPAATDAYAPDVVFVGDSITMGLQNYVEWQRETDPNFLGNVRFLTSSDFNIGMAEMSVSDTSVHPKLNGVKLPVEEALQRLNATTVLLMPGQADIRGYTEEKFIENVKLMIYQIQKAVPGVRLWMESVPPGVAGRYTSPDNERIFTFNLALYKLCLQFDIPFLDVAYALRDDQGNLPDSLCLDAETYGFHLNDAGCVQWLDFLRQYLAG